ncbi:hypothetical protein OJF2_69760 [Aquisphaera giovannonii]|uniref:Uncharacterized protein n=1 Tax=Aquisphaera giovannonii TaxID=406548 RepID=A0A5B9WE89_9BACT|nr:hypothetical protein [Aquisphaera giovannonii]QEH38375.1 hypothetical protein OJF2_69760 [Aquisphaera giovannonii]
MDQKLKDLVRRKQKQSEGGPKIDWDERRDTYLKAVHDLYSRIEEVLAEPIEDHTVHRRRSSKDLTEDFIGTYAVDDLILWFGDEQVRFSPRGRNILGAEGRVDVIGERGVAHLIFDGATWRVIQSRQPTLRTAPLDEGVIADMFNSVMRD